MILAQIVPVSIRFIEPAGRLGGAMARIISLLTVLAVLIAACGGSDDAATTTTTTVAAATSTTAQAETTSTTAPSTTTTTAAPATTTTEPAETTTTIATPTGPAEFAIMEVFFGANPYLTIANIGLGSGKLGGFWLCQRPSYYEIPPVRLEPGEVVAIALGGDVPDLIGITAVFDAGRELGRVVRADGELGLYTAPAFGDKDAIVDYVEWGSSGHGRSAVAVAAGIWVEDGFVPVPPEAQSIAVLSPPATGPDQWSALVGG